MPNKQRYNFYQMYNSSLQKILYQQCCDQRRNDVKKGIRVYYKNSVFSIVYSNVFQRAEEIIRFRHLLQKKFCLGIYTTNGNLMSKIQHFEINVDQDDQASFTTETLSLENGLINHLKYYLAIYRNASDTYKSVLSSDPKYFAQRSTYKSEQILKYIKDEIPEVPVDHIFYFQPQNDLRNQQQKKAILKSGRQSIMLIEGPAGVGKTKVGCLIGLQFAQKGKKVIMVTVTNMGAKMMCYHMVSQLTKDLHNLNQHSSFLSSLKGIMRVQTQFKCPLKQQFAIQNYDSQIKSMVKKMSKVPQKINFLFFNLLITLQQYFCLQPQIRFYSFNTQIIINIIKITEYKLSVLDIIKNVNKIANKVSVSDQFKKIYLSAVRKTIKNADLVITTTSRAARLNLYQEEDQLFRPYLAIFDEAAQATLADTYCILSLDIKRLVLIGDEKQLPPINKTPHKITETLFSILKKKPNRKLVQFDRQYRMNPQISKLVKYLTYGGQMKDAFKKNKQISDIEGFFKYPVFMVTHNGQQQQPRFVHEKGFYNIQEIKMIKQYINLFSDLELKGVGIITGYKAQENMMKVIFRDQVKLGLSISTVDGYQGAEKNYIFFSVVRSNDSGVLGDSQDRHRINVALSRAKKGLVIIGNISTLSQGNYYNPWKYVINYLQNQDLIFHFDEALKKKADEDYQIFIKRDMSKAIQVDEMFNFQDSNQLANKVIYMDKEFEIQQKEGGFDKAKQAVLHEFEEQPFIASNYN